jgi:hypothetical protein
LPEYAGVSQGYLSDIENDWQKPTKRFLHALEATTSISSDWIFSGEGQMLLRAPGNAGSYAPNSVASFDQRRAFNKNSGLHEKTRTF